MATLDDWMQVTYNCMDAVEVDRQPKEGAADYMVRRCRLNTSG